MVGKSKPAAVSANVVIASKINIAWYEGEIDGVSLTCPGVDWNALSFSDHDHASAQIYRELKEKGYRVSVFKKHPEVFRDRPDTIKFL